MPVKFVQVSRGGVVGHEVSDHAPYTWDTNSSTAAIVTVTIRDSTGGELVASSAATRGPKTTISANASAQATTISVTAATGISQGDVLLIGPNASGQWEWITVDGVNSSTLVLTLRDRLQYAYASGVAVKSPKVTKSLTATNCDTTRRNCRAEWAYTANGVACTETSLFHMSVWNPRLTLRDQDVLIRQPRAIDVLGTRQRLSQLIRDVWERDILEDVAARMDPAGLVDGDALRQAHLYRVLMEIALMAGDSDGRDRYGAQYKSAFDRALAGTLADTDGDGAISDSDIIRPAWTGVLRRA